MKPVSYSIICEDAAHSIFISEFLKHQKGDGSFALNKDCYSPWKFRNKSDVLKFYVAVSDRWFSNYQLDLLFIIVDYDDWDVSKFGAKHDELISALHNAAKSKSLLLLPVRAIEHWLYYLKLKADKPETTKNERIENMDRKLVKEHVYGTKRPYLELTENKVMEIMAGFDARWLQSRSDSFRHFYANFNRLTK